VSAVVPRAVGKWVVLFSALQAENNSSSTHNSPLTLALDYGPARHSMTAAVGRAFSVGPPD
jgi:hypothetical protein